MYFRPARTLFGLVAVGGAVAVGLTTHDAGFTALTFVGGLMLPRILGFRGRRAVLAVRAAAGPSRAGAWTSAWRPGTARPTATRRPSHRRRPQPAHDRNGPGSRAVPVLCAVRGYDDRSVRTVLVVDDEPEIVRILRDYLERAGFAVITASDGAAAVAMARRQRPTSSSST